MERRLVYDSDQVQPGRCPTCGKRLDRCSCARQPARRPPSPRAANLPRDGVVRIMRDRRGRGGKTVTLVAGLAGSSAALEQLTAELKRMCGTGGTLRDDVIEIQGDFRERVRQELARRGYTVKLAGG
ncbi:MAG: stress response translation initiation inhibitor YciH [Chloroflexota bacterium]|nr:stress response translation initiation inhibitor YciH [Chloroflexota bacterium]